MRNQQNESPGGSSSNTHNILNNTMINKASFSIRECAALFAVDETFIRYINNKRNIQTVDIPFSSLGCVLEEVLFYKEQFIFLGNFAKPERNDICLVFYVEYNTNSKTGNSWAVSSFGLKQTRIPDDKRKIFIIDDKKWYIRKSSWKRDTAYKDQVYVEFGHENWPGDKNYCIVIPIKSISRSISVFHPIIRRNDLYYLDYGQPSNVEILESNEFCSLAKNRIRGYCILDNQGFQITNYYRKISLNRDGSFWASYGEKNVAGSNYVYYSANGSIRTSAKFSSRREFSEGLCCVAIGDGVTSWGVINSSGEGVVDYKYDSATVFSNGICEVKVCDNCGYINKEGKAVTETGKLLISNSGETYAFAYIDKGKYRTNSLHIFTTDGEDLGYSVKGLSYNHQDAPYFGITEDGHVGFLNREYDIVIPLKYKEASRFYNGIARVVTDDGVVAFLNGQNEPVCITPREFSDMKAEVEMVEQRRYEALTPTPPSSTRRTYRVYYTDWNGIKKVYQTDASSKQSAIDSFWDSGVPFGVNIDFVE